MIDEPQKNWAGNYEYSAAEYHYPETVEQIQDLVTRSDNLKTLGTRHSFNNISGTRGDLVSLEYLDQVLALDQDHLTVTVGAGAKYGHLCRYLNSRGYALHNMASLPHISIAGACATATHGSGDTNGNLATAVSAMEIVNTDGEVVGLSREERSGQFEGAVVGLGGLGVVTNMTLDIIPAFNMRQDVYERLPLVQLQDHFEDIVSSAYSVSLFTDWRDGTINQVWLKRRTTEDDVSAMPFEWYGATLAPDHRHPIDHHSADGCTRQMGTASPWHEVLPHFRMEDTPSSGEELQSEYFVPREYGIEAILALTGLHEHMTPQLKVSEIRTVAADNLWMSPCYQQACIALHFTWNKDWPAVKPILSLIEDHLAPFQARPHWGKLFTMPPLYLQSLYKKLPDFQNMLRQFDPRGKCRNAFLDAYIFGE